MDEDRPRCWPLGRVFGKIMSTYLLAFDFLRRGFQTYIWCLGNVDKTSDEKIHPCSHGIKRRYSYRSILADCIYLLK